MISADGMIRIFNFIGGLVCHQRLERTLWIGGYYLPVCARDTGAFLGLLLGYTLLVFLGQKKASGPPNLFMTLAMMLPMLVDSFGQLLGFWLSTNDLRLITGLLFGTAMAPLLVYALSLPPVDGRIPLLRSLLPEKTVLDAKDSFFNARALLVGTAFSVILFILIRSVVGSELFLFYWMLSIPLMVEIAWHFFILPPILFFVALRELVRAKRSRAVQVSSAFS